MSGAFAEKISEIFKTELTMKSQICFDIILNGRSLTPADVVMTE